MTAKLPLALLLTGLLACEETEKESTETQTFQEWSDSYMNSRQNDSTDDVCSEFYQDCIDAGYSEEACATRTEECAQWGGEEREDEESSSTDEESECEREAREAYEDCVNSGSSQADCRSVYAEAYDDCLNRQE